MSFIGRYVSIEGLLNELHKRINDIVTQFENVIREFVVTYCKSFTKSLESIVNDFNIENIKFSTCVKLDREFEVLVVKISKHCTLSKLLYTLLNVSKWGLKKFETSDIKIHVINLDEGSNVLIDVKGCLEEGVKFMQMNVGVLTTNFGQDYRRSYSNITSLLIPFSESVCNRELITVVESILTLELNRGFFEYLLTRICNSIDTLVKMYEFTIPVLKMLPTIAKKD